MVNIKVRKKDKDMLAKGSLVFDVINYTLLGLLCLIVLYPLIYILSNSLSNYNAVYNGEVWLLPIGTTFENFIKVFKEPLILTGYANTLLYTFLGTIISMILTFTAAYVLSRGDFGARKPIMIIFTMTMFISGGMIPSYIVVDSLRLTDTMFGFILPGCMSVWNVIIVRTYMRTSISAELSDAAKIDGCNDFRLFYKIILPLSRPVLAIMLLFYGVGYWNSYYNALLYITNESLFPLQMILNQLIIKNDFSNMTGTGGTAGSFEEQGKYAEVLKYTTIVVSSLPILIIYPFLQKFFAKGLMAGSLKG